MASQRIHGITIDLDVNTSGVSESFKDINKSLTQTSRELKSVDKLLKDDAQNTTLLAQKQYLLTDAIDKTENKLVQLAKAKKQADESGEIDKSSKEYRELERDIARTKQSLENLNAQLKDNDAKMQEASESVDEFGGSLEDVSNEGLKFGDLIKANVISDAIIGGLKALANAVKDVAQQFIKWGDEFRELEVYEKQFESNIRNTADATDEEINALKQLARQKERSGVISKKAITSAYQELATYVESTDAIEGLTDALLDMSAQQYGVDATEDSVRNLATTLGKALANGDYSGLTRLGYGFDETQKKIMEFGTEAERVAVINEVISASIGGMNEALKETDAGKMFQFAHSFDDAKESVGGLVSELQTEFISGIAPDLNKFVDSVVGWIMDHKDEMIKFVQDIVGYLTSEEAKTFFTNIGELAVNLGTIIGNLIEILDQLGLLKGALELIEWVLQAIVDFTGWVVDGLKQINDELNRGISVSNPYENAGAYGSQYYGMHSGGLIMSGGIVINADFTVNTSDVSRSDVRRWADWLMDDINEGLGRLV